MRFFRCVLIGLSLLTLMEGKTHAMTFEGDFPRRRTENLHLTQKQFESTCVRVQHSREPVLPSFNLESYYVHLKRFKNTTTWDEQQETLMETLCHVFLSLNRLAEQACMADRDISLGEVQRRIEPYVAFAQENIFAPLCAKFIDYEMLDPNSPYGILPVSQKYAFGYIKGENGKYLVFIPTLAANPTLNYIPYGDCSDGIQYAPLVRSRELIFSPGLVVEQHPNSTICVKKYYGDQEYPLRVDPYSVYVNEKASSLFLILSNVLKNEGASSAFIPFDIKDDGELIEFILLSELYKEDSKEENSALLRECGYFDGNDPSIKNSTQDLRVLLFKDLSPTVEFSPDISVAKSEMELKPSTPLEKKVPVYEETLRNLYEEKKKGLLTTCMMEIEASIAEEQRKISEAVAKGAIPGKHQKKKKPSKSLKPQGPDVHVSPAEALTEEVIKRRTELLLLEKVRRVKLKYAALLRLLNDLRKSIISEQKMSPQDSFSLRFEQKGSHIVVHTENGDFAPFTFVHKHGKDPLYHPKEVKGLVHNLMNSLLQSLYASH